MNEPNTSNERRISRRRLLQAVGGTAGVTGFGSFPVVAAEDDGEWCPEATYRPSIVHYDDSNHGACADLAAKTSVQRAVRQSLRSTYPTVGSLIDAGFIPYFDFFTEGTVSHWINPRYIGDDSVLDPDRPESILVDHTWWRPIGVMYIATEEGERVDPPPPAVSEDGTDGATCAPWHAHVGVPGRYAWWKYRMVYEDGGPFPCRTPWMMHVWRYAQPERVFDHAAPPDRGGAPAESPGFDTDADPDETDLGPEHIPDALRSQIEDLWDRSA